MKEYLKIKLYDNGTFYHNNDEHELELACEIDFVIGDFDKKLSFPTMNTYVPIDSHKFYFLPGVTVPRVKLKELNSTYKIRTIREIENADVIFIGTKTIDTISDYNWEHKIETAAFRTFINEAKQRLLISDYYYTKIETALEFYTDEYLIVDYNSIKLLCHSDISFSQVKNISNPRSIKFNCIKSDYVALFNIIKDKQLYAEDALYDFINGPDAVAIDQSMYEVLCDMFKSSDVDNHILAMEIMANCDYKSSILYLCYLLNEHYYQIENRKERNHVNFKSLLVYMGKTTNYVALSKDDMVNLMIKKNLLTPEYYFSIADKFVNELFENGDSEHFKVKSLCTSNTVNAYFNKELVVQLKEDYQPSVLQSTNNLENEFTNTELDLI